MHAAWRRGSSEYVGRADTVYMTDSSTDCSRPRLLVSGVHSRQEMSSSCKLQVRDGGATSLWPRQAWAVTMKRAGQPHAAIEIVLLALLSCMWNEDHTPGPPSRTPRGGPQERKLIRRLGPSRKGETRARIGECPYVQRRAALKVLRMTRSCPPLVGPRPWARGDGEGMLSCLRGNE